MKRQVHLLCSFSLPLLAFTPFELLSLQCLCDGDFSSLFYAARCIRKLESRFGIIPTIKGKGASAKKVADIIVRMRRELPEESCGEGEEQEIDELILVDRESDLVTPMLTQLTYEGLIDDIYGISNGIVELPSELISSAPQVGLESRIFEFLG